MEPVTWFLTGTEKHSDSYRDDLYQNGSAFFGIMTDKMSRFKYPSLMCAMNELSNHDHSRFLTRTNRMIGRISTLGSGAAAAGINKGVFREAVTIQMTWPGAPTVYYADEAGQVGWTDPDNRRTYPWGHEDQSPFVNDGTITNADFINNGVVINNGTITVNDDFDNTEGAIQVTSDGTLNIGDNKIVGAEYC